MTGDKMIVGFIIWSGVALLFVSIGVKCGRSKVPVGFFANVETTQVENVEKYNKAVSKLWFVTATIYEIMGIPLLFLEQNSLYFIPIVFGVMFEMIVMMVVYLKIEAKYRVK